MRKIVFMLLAVGIFASCTKKSEANESGKDSAATVEVASQDAGAEAKALPSFASPDLALYNLRGSVKSISGSFCESDKNGKEIPESFLGYSITFDKDGVLQLDDERYYNIKTSQSERDAKGYLTKIHHEPDESYGGEVTYEFVYKDDRLVSSSDEWLGEISGGSDATYTYDGKGNLIKTVREGGSDGIKFTYTTTFTIKEKDDKGNWTKRHVSYEEVEIEDEYDEKTGDVKEGKPSKNLHYRMESRKIQYFE